MPAKPRRQTFHFGRPLAEKSGSLSPDSIRGFMHGASRLLLPAAPELDPDAINILTPTPSLDFSVLSSGLVRIARSNAIDPERDMPVAELKARLYDQMPARRANEATAQVVGVTILGKGSVLSLELESPVLRQERGAAVAALREVMHIGDHVDLTPSDHLNLPIGRFSGGVESAVADALLEVAGAFAEGRILTFAPIPNPQEQTQAQ